jgi:hypothetical protein
MESAELAATSHVPWAHRLTSPIDFAYDLELVMIIQYFEHVYQVILNFYFIIGFTIIISFIGQLK